MVNHPSLFLLHPYLPYQRRVSLALRSELQFSWLLMHCVRLPPFHEQAVQVGAFVQVIRVAFEISNVTNPTVSRFNSASRSPYCFANLVDMDEAT